MALSTYSDLVARAGEWLNRADLTPVVPDFIVLAEGSLRRKLRARTLVEQTLAVPASTGPIALGFDVQTVRSIRVDRAGSAPMSQVTIETLFDLTATRLGVAGVPEKYAVADGQLYLSPAPNAAYTLRLSYYVLLPTLVTGVPTATNWLLAKYPDCYLYATLIESAPFLMEDERVAVWASRLEQIVFEINREYEREELGANARTPRLSRVF